MILTSMMLSAAAALMQPVVQPAPAAPDPAYLAEQRRALDELSPSDGWRTTRSGLKYRVLIGRGTGERPTVQDRVMVHYVGRFTNGEVFDSSVERREAATFPLGRLIRGWQEGIPMMSVGERWEFAVPADLAYGTGRGPIPNGATLFFKVELVDVLPAEEAQR